METAESKKNKKKYPLGQGSTPVHVLKEAPLRFGKDVKPKDLAEIIFLLLKQDIDKYPGVYPHKERTYSALNGRLSGNYNARSIQDAYRLAIHYIPNKPSYKKIDEAIDKLSIYDVSNRISPLLSYSFCGTCRRYVYRLNNLNTTVDQIRERLGEYNIKISD